MKLRDERLESSGDEFPLKFSDEAREGLRRKGYATCFIEEKSLADLSGEGLVNIGWVRSKWFSYFEEKARPGEVAYGYRSDNHFIHGGLQNYGQLAESLDEHVGELGIPGIQGVIEHAAVYPQIQDHYYNNCFGRDFFINGRIVQTATRFNKNESILIGRIGGPEGKEGRASELSVWRESNKKFKKDFSEESIWPDVVNLVRPAPLMKKK